MTAANLLRHTLEDIFSEPDSSLRETKMRAAYADECIWIHPGGSRKGIPAIQTDTTEIRSMFPGYRYVVLGEIHSMQNVAMCHWGSGLPGKPFHYTGTDVLEEENGVAVRLYTFLDPPPAAPSDH